MNEDKTQNSFALRFKDKTVWNEFKEDLKGILRENDIKFQYSEKTPTFYILYKSDIIKVRVVWENDSLLFNLKAEKHTIPEQIAVCHEIYDLLILFKGELIEGESPYNW